MPPQFWSFDVFDTVLTRQVGRPEAVYPLVADLLMAGSLMDVSPLAFAAARERAQRHISGLSGRPPGLAAIYAEVARALNLDRATVPVWVAAEQEVERRLTAVVPGARELVAAARAADGTTGVLFVSDTPHTATFLAELLTLGGLLLDGDRVYSSADLGVSKARGTLFAAVARDLGAQPGQITHVGDHPLHDGLQAQAAGLAATRRPGGALNRYEKLLEKHGPESGGLTSRLAGAARLARLEAVAAGAPDAVAAVAAGVLAPLLLGFVLWLGHQARVHGVKRLHFVARDGQIMLEVARPVFARLFPDIELRYLHGSREAWLLAASSVSEDVLDDWLSPKKDATVRTTLTRVGLSVEQARQCVPIELFDERGADDRLTPDAARRLRQRLHSSPLLELVRSRAVEQRHAALAYLRQEGLASGVPAALVDAGWRGHSARAFDRLAVEAGGVPARHLLLGLFPEARGLRSGDDAPDMTAWLLDRDLGHSGGLSYIEQINVAVEMFFAGTEGRTVGYRKQDGRVCPVLLEAVNEPVLSWGLQHVRDTVDRVVRQVVPELRPQHVHVDLREPCWNALYAFWMTPTAAEARAWGSFPWEEETWPPFYPIAEPLSALDVVRRRLGRPARHAHDKTWLAGVRQLTPGAFGAALRFRGWQLRHARSPRSLLRTLRRAVGD